MSIDTKTGNEDPTCSNTPSMLEHQEQILWFTYGQHTGAPLARCLLALAPDV